jgi:hypothetical protein
MSSTFDIQPIGRFVGQSAVIKRPKVSAKPFSRAFYRFASVIVSSFDCQYISFLRLGYY